MKNKVTIEFKNNKESKTFMEWLKFNYSDGLKHYIKSTYDYKNNNITIENK